MHAVDKRPKRFVLDVMYDWRGSVGGNELATLAADAIILPCASLETLGTCIPRMAGKKIDNIIDRGTS